MTDKSGFHTQKGYELIGISEITTSMEDYLEMISRMLLNSEYVRINELSKNLNVKPSSASKMVTKLCQQDFISFEHYGYIKLTEKGMEYGNYLLYRHDVLNRFLCYVNSSENELEEVEKIEHFFDRKTIKNIDALINKLNNDGTCN